MQRFESNSPLLPEILSLHGKWRATQEAVICSDVRLDWRQFTQSYHQFAHGLNSHGIDRSRWHWHSNVQWLSHAAGNDGLHGTGRGLSAH